MSEIFNLKTTDNQNIAVTHWPATGPTKAPKAVLLWAHGFAEHRKRYAHFADFLNQNSITLIAYDVRGHGDSSGPRGYVGKYSDFFYDIETVLKKTKELYTGAKLILGSHSHGGLICSRYLQTSGRQEDFIGAVFSAPFLRLALEVPEWKKTVGKLVASFLGNLAMKNEIDTNFLSHDPEIVKQYNEDPLVFDIARAGWFAEVVENQPLAIAEAGKIKLPTLVMHGDDDRIAAISGTREFYANLAEGKKKMIEYPGFYHEILNEVGKEKVYNDILSFINSVV